MKPFAVAIMHVNSILCLRPPRPAMPSLNSSTQMPGAPFELRSDHD